MTYSTIYRTCPNILSCSKASQVWLRSWQGVQLLTIARSTRSHCNLTVIAPWLVVGVLDPAPAADPARKASQPADHSRGQLASQPASQPARPLRLEADAVAMGGGSWGSWTVPGNAWLGTALPTCNTHATHMQHACNTHATRHATRSFLLFSIKKRASALKNLI